MTNRFLLATTALIAMAACGDSEAQPGSPGSAQARAARTQPTESQLGQPFSGQQRELIVALPLPDAVRGGPEVSYETGYAVEPIGENVWMVTDGLYQAMFAATGEGVVVFDAPPTIGGNLSRAIAETTDEPVTHLVYSHSHIDHIGAASQFDGVEIVASEETAAKISRFDDESRPDPTVTFAEDYTLTVGDLTAELSAAGEGHEPGNLFIYLPDDGVLMAVDIAFPGWVPFTNLGMAEDVGRYAEHFEELLAFDFDTFVGGHVGRAGTRDDVETQAAYVADLVDAANEGRRTVDFTAVAERTGYDNKWLLVRTYMDEVADVCTETMMAKWSDRLGGADVNTAGHCWVMQEFLNINGEPSL